MNDIQKRQELSARFDKLDNLSATIAGQWLVRHIDSLDELEVAVSLGEKLAEVAKKDEERRRMNESNQIALSHLDQYLVDRCQTNERG